MGHSTRRMVFDSYREAPKGSVKLTDPLFRQNQKETKPQVCPKTLFQPSRPHCQPFRGRQSGLISIETQKLPCTHRERRRHVQDVHASMSALCRVSC